MPSPISPGQLVLGEYQIERIQSEDAAWVRVTAEHEEDGRVELQILRPDINWGTLVDELFDFFDTLGNASKKHLHLPQHIIGDAEFPLVLVFGVGETQPLAAHLSAHPEQMVERWHEASEALHALHNRGLTAGFVAPQQWEFRDGKTMLCGLGYAPILRNGPHQVRNSLEEAFGEFLSPETRRGEPSKAGDVWSLAMCVAHTNPEFRNSAWFHEATNPDPAKRPRSMRLAWSGMEKALQSLYSASDPPTLEAPPSRSGALVPKYEIQVRVEPEGAGEVDGAGRIAAGAPTQIIARAREGWQFNGWSGDIVSNEAGLRFEVDAPKSVVAHFSRVARHEFVLSARIEPSQAGEVLGVGRYFAGDEVTLRVHPYSGWRFVGWSQAGLTLSQQDELSFKITASSEVTARFERVPTFLIATNIDPPESGQVRGAGSFTQGTTVALRAFPAALFRFSHWSGSATGNKNPTDLVVSGPTNVTAHFVQSIWEEPAPQNADVTTQSPVLPQARIGAAFTQSAEKVTGQSVVDANKSTLGGAFSVSSSHSSVEPTVVVPEAEKEEPDADKSPQPILGKAFSFIQKP